MASKTEDVTATPLTLGEEMNKATRPLHTKLNKLVVSRMRLALPPHADDAKSYTTGLLHILPIYQAFEQEWDAVLEDSPTAAKPDDRVTSLLADLRVEGLARTSALTEDVAALLGRDDALVRARTQSVSHAPALVRFQEHIRKTVRARPHVLVAYAWVLYMALFSGGRFMRASLERVDRSSGFWPRPAAPSSPSSPSQPSSGDDDDDKPELGFRMPGAFDAFRVIEEDFLRKNNFDNYGNYRQQEAQQQQQQPPLSFLHFETPEDGEDLKRTFKETLAAATSVPEPRLTGGERADVVREAQAIFEHMMLVVEELDEICGTEYEEQVAAAAAAAAAANVVLEREKRMRKRVAVASASATAAAVAVKGRRVGTGVKRGETTAALPPPPPHPDLSGRNGDAKGTTVRFE
ncbi:heme oxygenase-like protein [Daldinia caldariorum]|uniref:heme oxygenase-like protein n=1 Tax=Daldinia caldariorum TaxID=326644 RepID=UPI0020081D3C|nr:heme oxygenase-like protein [Daldinia caldariorum]KAI1469778.1 heme oxygenase-like protein [Daldinia caldariorum]